MQRHSRQTPSAPDNGGRRQKRAVGEGREGSLAWQCQVVYFAACWVRNIRFAWATCCRSARLVRRAPTLPALHGSLGPRRLVCAKPGRSGGWAGASKADVSSMDRGGRNGWLLKVLFWMRGALLGVERRPALAKSRKIALVEPPAKGIGDMMIVWSHAGGIFRLKRGLATPAVNACTSLNRFVTVLLGLRQAGLGTRPP